MKRTDFPTLAIRGALIALVCALAPYGAAAAPSGAALKAISVSPSASPAQLQLRIDGDFTYQTVFVSSDTLFINLTNTSADRIPKTGEWSGGVLTGYRLVQFTDAAHRPVVRVHVELKHHEEFRADRNSEGLLVTFGDHAETASGAGQEVKHTVPASAALQTQAVAENPQPPKPHAGLVEVSALFVSAGPQGEVHVDVDTSQPTPYRVLRLENPRRLVVDLNGARKGFHQRAFSVPSTLANGIRVGQFQAKNPPVVRVVVDVAGNPVIDVHARPGGIRIELKPRLAAQTRERVVSPALNAKTRTDVPALVLLHGQEPVLSGAKDAHARPVADTKTRSEAVSQATNAVIPAQDTHATVKNAAAETSAALLVHADYQKALPPETGAKEVTATPALASAGPAPEAVAAANAARVIAKLTAAKLDASGPADLEAQASGQTAVGPTGAAQAHYTGEPISINFKDLDLKDFFRFIHEISGLNIIVDPDVTGSVTLVLDNVPWDQALDLVLKDNGLGKTLEGNVLRISKLSTLTAEQEVVSKLAIAQTAAEPLVTRFMPLSYAKATDVAALLKTVAGGGALSSRGTAVVDNRTNTIIVTDVASQIPVVSAFIAKLDTKSKQVSIEARIIVATRHFERQLQSALNYGYLKKAGTTLTSGDTGAGASEQGNIPVSPSTPRITVGQTNASGFGAFVINNLTSRYFINAMIAAAENKAEAKTISNPMIITQNNTLGTVLQGVQIPIQTTVNLTITVTYVNAALQLSVTPQVTADGNVFMNIKVDNSSVGSLSTLVGPSINTQSATTQVLVPDGGTVVFGGITVQAENKSADYIPWLGQIPVLGHLFKNTTRITDNNELLFFVTPKILPG